MTETQFEQFTVDLLGWLAETFGEEISAQTSAWIEENKAKYFEPEQVQEETTASAQQPSPSSPAPTETSQMSQQKKESQIILELQKRIAQLEAENRLKDFKAYTEQLIHRGKLFPSQENLAISLLELGHKQGVTTYAESSLVKEIHGVELVKKLLESYPELNLYQETVKKTETTTISEFQEYEIDQSALELHTKVLNYIEEAKKSGKTISYKEALSIITKGGQ